MERVLTVASQRPVVIFAQSSCCMCHAVKTLFLELGTVPEVYAIDHDPGRRGIEMALVKLLGCDPAVPSVFIGGNPIGATDTILTLHLSGRLVPLLMEAGAILAPQLNP